MSEVAARDLIGVWVRLLWGAGGQQGADPSLADAWAAFKRLIRVPVIEVREENSDDILECSVGVSPGYSVAPTYFEVYFVRQFNLYDGDDERADQVTVGHWFKYDVVPEVEGHKVKSVMGYGPQEERVAAFIDAAEREPLFKLAKSLRPRSVELLSS